jgi:hypothetical protein
MFSMSLVFILQPFYKLVGADDEIKIINLPFTSLYAVAT